MPRPPAGKQKKPKKNPFGDVEEEEPKPRKLTAEERRAEKAAELSLIHISEPTRPY